MIYISAGHHLKDPGAIGIGGVKESDLTMELRNLTLTELSKLGAKVITDKDTETLSQYLQRIKPGDASVVCEIHFNASSSASATGTEVVVPSRGGSAWEQAKEAELSQKIAAMITRLTGIKLRGNKGVITETETARGGLAIMREDGINVLVEVCFITNANDLAAYKRNKAAIAKELAALLVEADGWKA